MTRRSKIFLFLPGMLILCVTGIMAWLMYTGSGARWLWQQVESQLDGKLRVSSISGSLQAGLQLTELRYQDESVLVHTPEATTRFDFGLFPPSLEVHSLRSQDLLIRLLDQVQDNEPANLAEVFESLYLPFQLSLDEVQVSRITIENEDSEVLFGAIDLVLQATWFRTFRVEHLEMSTVADEMDSQWQLSGEMELARPFDLQARLAVNSRFNGTGGSGPTLDAHAEFEGDLQTLTTRIELDQPEVRLAGELRNLLTEPGWQLEGTAGQLGWPLNTAENEVQVSQLRLVSEGIPNTYRIEAEGLLSGPRIPAAEFVISGRGNLLGLDVENLDLSGDIMTLAATGRVSWEDRFLISAKTQIDQLDPKFWMDEWPEQIRASGAVNLTLADGLLEIDNLNAGLVDNPLRVEGNGRYDLETETVQGNLHWQSLAWPPGDDTPEWSSESGQLQLSGQPEDWNASGDIALQVDGFPPGKLNLAAQGNSRGLKLQIARGELLDGSVSGELEYAWTTPYRWTADLLAENVTITPLVPDYPGWIRGQFIAAGNEAEDQLHVELRDVTGSIRGLPTRANGAVSLTAGKLRANNFVLESGSAELHLDGNFASQEGLQFTARIDQLGEVLPGASGSFESEGLVSIHPGHPRINLALNGENLVIGELAIPRISSQQDPDDGLLTVSVEKATLGQRVIQDFRFSQGGEKPLQDIQIQGKVDETRFDAALTGAVVDWSDLLAKGWQGRLTTLRAEADTLGFLELEQPAALAASAGQARLDTACFRETSDGRVCLQANWQEPGEFDLDAQLEDIAIDIARLFVDSDWNFTQKLDGSIRLDKGRDAPVSAVVNLDVSAGELIFDQEESLLRTGSGRFEFQVSDGRLHSGQLDVPVPGQGGIHLDFSVGDLASGAESPVTAHVLAHLNDISPFRVLLPNIDTINGELNADIRVEGTLGDPQLTGHSTLVRGRIEHFATGMVLSDIQLAGAVYQYDHTELNGTFRAGDGRGRIRADVRFEDFLNPQVQLEIGGENLLLVNVPDLNLVANPDLDIKWQGSELELNGRVLVPRANLSPRYLPTSGAVESEDLVIVSNIEAMDTAAESPASTLRIRGRVELELGDAVNVQLEKATANVRGKTEFTWSDDPLPIAEGAFAVSGEIYAYGQLLTIDEGRVSFPRIKADNPHLNITAEREIFGNTQVKRAGVLISGTLKQPVMETYTYPLTTRERALTLLLTGNDFDYEQGRGAVEVGMYVAPRLFISYGIGLFEDQNVISARYDLKKGFGIKATSGQRETGVDISYTIEH